MAPEMLLFSQWPPWLVTPNRTRFCAALRELHCVVDEILDERLREREPRDDFLGLLLEAHSSEVQPAARPQIRDEIMTLLLAGHETTASALTWTWWLLSGDATVERRMLDELAQQLGSRAIRSPDVERLPYLRAVIGETMRLYPPAYGIGRRAVHADELGGYAIRAGTWVVACEYTTHRNPAYWHEPERFDPSRFVGPQLQERPAFAYFPFGGGQRMCIGAQFALLELQLVVATIARRVRFERVDDTIPAVQASLTLRPRHGVRLRRLRR